MKDLITPPAIVQDAYTAANSIRLAATHWSDVKIHGQQALAAARKAGDALLRAKAECPHGEWLALLERTWPGSYHKAARCMRIAANWAEVEEAESPADALRMLAEDAPDAQSLHAANFDPTEQPPADDAGETTSGEPAKRSSGRSSGGAGKPATQGTLDFTGETAEQKAAQAALARKRKLLDEAISATEQLLEVMPELTRGAMGGEFSKLAEASGFGPVSEKHTENRFVNKKVVAAETYANRFPTLESFLAAMKGLAEQLGAK